MSEAKTVEKNDDFSPKPVNLAELGVSQRQALKGGLQEAIMGTERFKVLGAEQKVMFYSTMNMMHHPEALQMLNISGEEYFKTVKVPGEKDKKEKYFKFTFDFVIPGTNNSIRATKEWRSEDFR